jgi:hypothetical protein
MVRTLVLNSSNIVPNTDNSVLRYNFPQGGIFLQDEYIGVQQISLYNSVFNISASLNNNVFSYTWVNGITYPVVMPSDGIHLSLSQINAYLQSVMVANQHYLINSSNQFVYLLEIVVNQSRYAYQINAFSVSVSIASTNNWTLPLPTPSWSLPNSSIMPMLNIPNTDFQTITGFDAGSYPNTVITGTQPNQSQTPVQTSPYSALSQNPPQIEPQSTYLGLCSLVNNKLVIPNQTIVAITPINIDFGGLFTIQYSAPAFNKVENGNYTGFTFSFVDGLGERIAFQDPNILIILIMRNKNDTI